MNINPTADLRARLNAAKGQWPEIATGSGVPYSTIQKIAQGKTRNPGVETFTAIDRALRELGARLAGAAMGGG